MSTTGTVTTYGATSGLMLDFEPMIALLDPFDVPILGGVASDGGSLISKAPAFEKKVQWHDETSLTPRTTLGAAAVTADVVLTITSGERERFQTDDILLIDSEYIRVTGYSTTASVLNVSRAWSGTAAQHSNAAAVVGVGSAPAEGADPSAARFRDRDEQYNLTETFGPYAVTVSGSELAVRKFGLVGTEFDHQVANRTKEAAIAMEQAIIYGVRADDSTSRRTMAGIRTQVTTNVDSSTTTLTEAKLLDQLQNCFDAGGSPNRISGGSKQKRVISAFTSAGVIQVMRPDSQRGTKVDTFISDFGECVIILDRWYRTADLDIWAGDQVELCVLRPLHYEPLAKTGDAEKGMIVGEYSTRVRAQKHAAKFTALT